MNKRYSNRISKFEDLKGFNNVQFVVLYEDSLNYNDGYGGTSTTHYLQVEGFENEEQLKEWILNEVTPKAYSRTPRNYKILRWQPVEPVVQVTINL